MNDEAAKMKYAWETLNKKYGMSRVDEQYIDYWKIKNCYKSLLRNYSL